MIKRVDIGGISLSRFHQAVLEQDLDRALEPISREAAATPENIHYIISWRADETAK